MIQNRRQAFIGIEDEHLVDVAKFGDHLAFAELVERHYHSCLKLSFSILRDRSDAEDEVQNGCWKAFEHLDQFNREAKFSTWLARIVVNQCLMRLRQAKRARLFYIDDLLIGDEVVSLQLRDEGLNPEQAVGKSEVAVVVRSEINRIPPLLRDVFVLRDVNQLPMQDVANLLSISVAAAKSRLLRARQELRIRLSRHQSRLGAASLLTAQG
ncbi:RNA polymerase sigma factor [Bryobacter aggregatus]|uniref:RNA polymerase sigma factor n=1 Tax=Bryobacter aggregatus TaxID=360054 RepID=UPI0009B5B660|nr:sigma-70 family RNA polymerase sigma factor [Bryobacter aggregatus]